MLQEDSRSPSPAVIDPPATRSEPPPRHAGLAPSMTSRHSELARELCGVMARIHQRGWCDGTGGNFSCVVSQAPLQLLMAPSGVDKGLVQPQELLLVDAQGEVLVGEGRASAETLLHLQIVRCTGAGAVLHTHSQAGTLLSALWDPAVGAETRTGRASEHGGRTSDRSSDRSSRADGIAVGIAVRDADGEGDGDGDGVNHLVHRRLEMLKGLSGISTHATEVRVPVLSNDQDLRRLSDRAASHLQEAPHGLLIAGHGLYAWGRELGEAMRHLEIHEFLLEQRWRLLLLEGLPGRASSAMGSERGEDR